jgi:hypothetical protein
MISVAFVWFRVDRLKVLIRDELGVISGPDDV